MKGYFPNHFNKPAYQNYIGKNPNENEYGVKNMMTDDYEKEFNDFYNSTNDDNLKKTILNYQIMKNKSETAKVFSTRLKESDYEFDNEILDNDELTELHNQYSDLQFKRKKIKYEKLQIKISKLNKQQQHVFYTIMDKITHQYKHLNNECFCKEKIKHIRSFISGYGGIFVNFIFL